LSSEVAQSKSIIQVTEERISITETTKRQIEEVAQTRQRSYTALENNYNELKDRLGVL
jgi:predicted nuclease with TOPRIM domain